MFDKRGIIEDDLIQAAPYLVVLAIVLAGFTIIFWGCELTRPIGFCGGKPADVVVEPSQTGTSSQVLALLQTSVQAEGAQRGLTLADVAAYAYQEEQQGFVNGVYREMWQREVKNALALMRFAEENPKIRAAWNVRVVALPEKVSVPSLAVLKSLDSFGSEEIAQQDAVVPLRDKKGALRVELYLECKGCRVQEARLVA